MRPFPGGVKAYSSRGPAIWIGPPLSLVAGLLFYVATSASIESDAQARFANHAEGAQHTIGARIKSYTDVLRGAASLFHTGETITRAQFHDYVAGLAVERHFPAIETINFSEYVRGKDLDAFQLRLRAEQLSHPDGRPPFTVSPPGKRPEHSVLTFIEGRVVEQSTFGTDMFALTYVRAALLASRDSGNLITSGRPIPAISSPNRIGLGMRLPIYRPNMPLTSTAERRAAYVGSVGIAFRVPNLVQGVLDEMAISNVRLILVDGGVPERSVGTSPGDRVLFDSGETDVRNKRLDDAEAMLADYFSHTLPVDFNGRMWKATFRVQKSELYTGFDEYFPRLAMLAGFIGTMLIYALLHTLTSSRMNAIKMAKDMTKELRESQTKLQLSHENLRRLAAHADNIKEGERKRIAREIHDDLGQNLLALRIEADMLSSRTRDSHPRLHARARATLQQIDATIKSVRQIINDLRPNVLDLGLNAAVDWQITEFRRRTGITCDLVENDQDIRISDHCATALFRILQESLSNISRHARASAVRVELWVQDDQISMTVRDNGVGLLQSGRNKPGSFGLVGIEERIHILGGSFSITSIPGKGTTVGVTVPLMNDDGFPARSAARETAADGTAVVL